MKRNIFTLLALLSLIIASCVKAPSVGQPEEISNESLAMFNNINPIETLQVPAVEGKITVVTFNGDIICLTKTPTSIPVPKSNAFSKADEGVEIKYVDESDPEYVDALGTGLTTANLWQTVAFEDSKVGDYDYNDLVVHINQEVTENNLYIGLHPIAYGATKDIALGMVVYYKDERVFDDIIIPDTRQAFLNEDDEFCGIGGYINTFTMNYHRNFFTHIFVLPAVGQTPADVKIVWYIQVDKTLKLYAVNNKYNFLDGNKRPYGLLITNTGKTWDLDGKKEENSASWFEYPIELNNISTVYTGSNGFDNWINSVANFLDMISPAADKVFKLDQKGFQGKIPYQISHGNKNHLNDKNGKYNKIRKPPLPLLK